MPKPQTSVQKPMDVLRNSIDRNVLVDVKGNRGDSEEQHLVTEVSQGQSMKEGKSQPREYH